MTTIVTTEDGALDFTTEREDTPEDHALAAMDQWDSGGSFAGDPYPEKLRVSVETDGAAPVLVDITVDWSPNFYAEAVK